MPFKPVLFALTALSSLLAWPSWAAAPAPQAIATVQSFADYLTQPRTNIGAKTPADLRAQEQWLAPALIAKLRQAVTAVEQARKLPEVEGPDPRVPDNGSVLDSWELPSHCAARPAAQKTNRKNTVQLLCSWGPKTNYAGLKRRYTLQLIQVDGDYKVLDIVGHKNAYAPESAPLSQRLQALVDEAAELTRQSNQQAPN